MQKTYFIKFNNRIKWGSSEHFFHFMWGYLLPALNEINQINESSKTTNDKFLFSSCGPIMDKLTCEILSLFQYNYEIIDKSSNRTEDHSVQILVPRWDIWLNDLDTAKNKSRLYLLKSFYGKLTSAFILQKETEFIMHPFNNALWKILLNSKEFATEFLASILKVKIKILENLVGSIENGKVSGLKDQYLILKRSSQPKFYGRGGKAEIPTYGTGRRALMGIEEAAEYLSNKNIPVKIFEPGRFSLTEQINVFQHCKGIVGIKGAEFANLIWMKPQSKVILLRPLSMDTRPEQKSLSNILGLDYHEITTQGGFYPTLNGEEILNYLNNE